MPTPRQVLESRIALTGKSKKNIAKELSITHQTLNNWLNQFPDGLKYKDILRLCRIVNVSAADILKEIEEISVGSS